MELGGGGGGGRGREEREVTYAVDIEDDEVVDTEDWLVLVRALSAPLATYSSRDACTE